MCCSFETVKRVVPFAITFALGLFVASAFYSFAAPTKVKDSRLLRVEKVPKHKTKKCDDKKRIKIENEVEEEIIFLIDGSFSEVETTVFPPTPPETVILKEELSK